MFLRIFFAKKNGDEVVIKNTGVKHFLLQCHFFFTPDRTKTTILPELKNILDFTRQVGRGHVGHLNQRPKWHGWPNFGDLLTLPLAPTWDWHLIRFERNNSTNVEWITMIIVPSAGQSFQLLSEISQHVGLLNGLGPAQKLESWIWLWCYPRATMSLTFIVLNEMTVKWKIWSWLSFPPWGDPWPFISHHHLVKVAICQPQL